MPRLPFCLTALVAALALSSCSLNEISKMDKEASGQADTAQRVLQSRQTLTQPTVVWSDKPWVNLQPVTPVISTPDEKNLPACQITINRPEGISLPELGQRITALCGIRVSITPDAFAALSSISTGSVVTSQMNGQLPAPDDNGRVPLSQMGTTSAQPVSVQSSPSLIRGLKYQGDIRGLLDMAASGLGLSWRSDSSGVYFYQQDTRTFQLVILNTKVNSSASINSGSGNQLGSGGGTSGGTTGDISSNQKTDYGMNSDLYDDIKKTVEQMVTPKSGRFWLSSATGTLSVTDTPDVLNRIGRYIEYPEALIPGQREIGSTTSGNMWGNVYPRSGFVTQTDSYKSAAVVVQRVADIITRQGQLHVYSPLTGQRSPGYWPPEPVQENTGTKNHKWQRLSPQLSQSCAVFPDTGGLTAEDGNYAWALWQPYSCCKRRGQTFLYSTDFS